jgi:hypothetical protein
MFIVGLLVKHQATVVLLVQWDVTGGPIAVMYTVLGYKQH